MAEFHQLKRVGTMPASDNDNDIRALGDIYRLILPPSYMAAYRINYLYIGCPLHHLCNDILAELNRVSCLEDDAHLAFQRLEAHFARTCNDNRLCVEMANDAFYLCVLYIAYNQDLITLIF